MFFFFFNDTATTEIYTLSLHDALPIWSSSRGRAPMASQRRRYIVWPEAAMLMWPSAVVKTPVGIDRKSTRLNSSHSQISYAVFCLKKKKIKSYAENLTNCV